MLKIKVPVGETRKLAFPHTARKKKKKALEIRVIN